MVGFFILDILQIQNGASWVTNTDGAVTTLQPKISIPKKLVCNGATFGWEARQARKHFLPVAPGVKLIKTRMGSISARKFASTTERVLSAVEISCAWRREK